MTSDATAAANETDELMERVLGLADAALDKKAISPVILDLRGKVSFTDAFLICEGSSGPHVRAIADGVRQAAKQRFKYREVLIEGERLGRWVLIDLGDVVIHIFDDESRAHYDLEGMWADAPRVAVPGATTH